MPGRAERTRSHGPQIWDEGLVLAHAFTELGLHRLEANDQPGNAASIELVRRCGFVRDG